MLRFEIDGRWSPEDFIEIFQATETIYYQSYFSDSRHLGWLDRDLLHEIRRRQASFSDDIILSNEHFLNRSRRTVRTADRITVNRISYASPGEIDFLGIGKACESLANVVGRIISHFEEKEIRRERASQAKLETERQRIDVEKEYEALRAIRIDNCRKILELSAEFTDEVDDLMIARVMQNQEKIEKAVRSGKLIAARYLSGEGSDW